MEEYQGSPNGTLRSTSASIQSQSNAEPKEVTNGQHFVHCLSKVTTATSNTSDTEPCSTLQESEVRKTIAYNLIQILI